MHDDMLNGLGEVHRIGRQFDLECVGGRTVVCIRL